MAKLAEPKLYINSNSIGTLTSFGNFNTINSIWNWEQYPYLLINKGKTHKDIQSRLINDVSFYTCFDPYWRKYTTDKFFFSHPIYPLWYDKVIEEFNEYFSNIKIHIIDEKDVKIKRSKEDIWGEDKIEVSLEGENELKTTLLNLELSDKYNQSADTIIKYFIHHFLRMISITEKLYVEFTEKDPKEDYVEYVLGINNRRKGYRSLAERTVELSRFLLFDNIELANEVFTSIPSSLRQTEIYGKLSKMWNVEKNRRYTQKEIDEMTFKVGDLLIGKPNNGYRLTTEESVCKVLQTSNVNKVFIEIVKHKTKDFAIGAKYWVNIEEFVRIKKG